MKIWETDTFLARWLNDDLSSEEKEAFEKSEEFEAYQNLIKGVDQFEMMPFDERSAMDEALKRIQNSKKETEVKKLIPWKSYMAAASLFIVALLSIYFLFFNDRFVEYTAEKQEYIKLPDGSSVELKAGSFIKYNLSGWEDKRNITLKGEAFFEVKKGNAFEVTLNQGSVKVLGTSFSIEDISDSLIVVCYSGKVEVNGFKQKEILDAGQTVILASSYKNRQNTLLAEPIWVDNVAAYNNAPIEEVIQQFEALFNVEIIGELDQRLLYTGQFPIDDIEIALEQIFGPFQINYEYKTEERTVIINSIVE